MTRTKTPKASTSSQPANSTKPSPKHKQSSQGRKQSRAPDSQRLPGVQKIKASLRQTRRLLAKDNLAADVRVETERRLRALEKDLSDAQKVRKERTLATRYHKVKFFERQKVLRRITQVKRDLEACSDKKEKKGLKKSLFSLRVDLNYILHYPKTKKYVSLFPPEVRSGDNKPLLSVASEEGDNISPTSDKQREEIRRWIKDRMERNELSGEPELEINTPGQTPGTSQGPQEPQEASPSEHGRKAKLRVQEPPLTPAIEGDAFFGDDSEDQDDD